MDRKSLSHTRWQCQYHIVFIPKYRKKKLYGQVKRDVREYTAQTKCIEFHGIPEREKYADDIRQASEYAEQVG